MTPGRRDGGMQQPFQLVDAMPEIKVQKNRTYQLMFPRLRANMRPVKRNAIG